MPPVPLLMVLYSSDAVEVRYSDGSCLELSPCGSSMIHHDAPTRGEHPRHDLSKKIQKRTRFVTSEHKHKVLQALDFRNRFADRPYLCEDLLRTEDILALYARIDNIAWPKLPEKAKVEIQPDGSRRITSLDEYASLVVSPHGHDFTVCYLSRISEDKDLSKRSRTQVSRSSANTSTQSSISSTQTSKESSHHTVTEQKCSSKPNEAVVHPFKTGGQVFSGVEQHATANQFSELSWEMQRMSLQNVNLQGIGNVCLAADNSHHADLEHDNHFHKGPVGFPQTATNSKDNCDVNIAKPYADNKISEARQNLSSLSNVKSTHSNNTSHTQSFSSNPFPNHAKCNPEHPFAVGSPNSHDLSSISRSSTPDGLRTTIDSEATLLCDNTTDGSQGKGQVYKQGHSSPTQYTSSPYDVPVDPLPKKFVRVENANISLSGSFLGNQEQHSVKELTQPLDETLVQKSYSEGDKSQSSVVSGHSGTLSGGNLNLQQTLAEHSKLMKQHSSTTSVNGGQHLVPADNSTDVEKLNSNNNNINYNNENEGHKKKTLSINSDTLADPASAKDGLQVDNQTPSQMTDKSSELFVLDTERDMNATEKQHRQRYIWTTKHASRNECPLVWSHPLKLALETTTVTDEDLSTHPTLRRLQAMSASFKANEKKCIFTAVPSPLLATCPFQHIHKWTASGGLTDSIQSGCNTNPGEFQHGRLKIVLSEGIIYRLVERGEMRVVEIHPGDGSVLVSQGVRGHFFTHYVLVGDQLEERTYSLKSLPPGQLKRRYSIENLIKTANRFMLMNSQWERRGLKEDIPCWKKEVVAVVEPLSSSLLEECHVEGLGKFTAFTNGRVRIVFEDRAALDMVCNFSRRVKECLQHSKDPQASLPCASSVSPPVTSYESIFGASSGRLLLPNGKYVTVDINNPGPYRKYIQAAQEWASWVNATPIERQEFYSQHHLPSVLRQAAEIELRKIFCFNYILEQTTLMQQPHQSMITDPSTDSGLPAASSPSLDHWQSSPRLSSSQQPHQQLFLTGADRSPRDYQPYSGKCTFQKSNIDENKQKLYSQNSENFVSLATHNNPYSRGSYPLSHNSSPSGVVYRSPREHTTTTEWSQRTEEKANKKVAEITQGFQAVRQVLLQNSNLISDIDAFLESSKNS